MRSSVSRSGICAQLLRRKCGNRAFRLSQPLQALIMEDDRLAARRRLYIGFDAVAARDRGPETPTPYFR